VAQRVGFTTAPHMVGLSRADEFDSWSGCDCVTIVGKFFALAVRYGLEWLISLPFPQIDIIGAMLIVWRVRGKLSGLFCAILCAAIVHSAMHTHINIPNNSLDWVLSHWAHFTVRKFIFVHAICVSLYTACTCSIVNMVRWTWCD